MSNKNISKVYQIDVGRIGVVPGQVVGRAEALAVVRPDNKKYFD